MDAATTTVDSHTLAAARRTLLAHGLAGMTMQRVAEQAGLSRVTLHRRGVTRDTILEALAVEGVDAYRRALWPVLTSPEPARVRLELALRALIQEAEANLEVLVALRSISDAIFHEDPGAADGEALTRDVFTEPLERILADGGADGTLVVRDARISATVLFNLVGWTYVHLRTGHRWSAERAATEVLHAALHGMLHGP